MPIILTIVPPSRFQNPNPNPDPRTLTPIPITRHLTLTNIQLALFQLAWDKSWRKKGSRILSTIQLNWMSVKTKSRKEFTHARKISRKYDRHHAHLLCIIWSTFDMSPPVFTCFFTSQLLFQASWNRAKCSGRNKRFSGRIRFPVKYGKWPEFPPQMSRIYRDICGQMSLS